MPTPNPLSKCCKAGINEYVGSDFGFHSEAETAFYICKNCGQSCEVLSAGEGSNSHTDHRNDSSLGSPTPAVQLKKETISPEEHDLNQLWEMANERFKNSSSSMTKDQALAYAKGWFDHMRKNRDLQTQNSLLQKDWGRMKGALEEIRLLTSNSKFPKECISTAERCQNTLQSLKFTPSKDSDAVS